MAVKSIAAKLPAFPGFNPLSDQIYVWQGDSSVEEDAASPDPATIIIYGWGDGQPKHLIKYTDGFRKLFPKARIIVVLSPIIQAMSRNLDQRVQSMRPVIKTAFPSLDPSNKAAATDQSLPSRDSKILVHVMSNTGGLNLAATLEAYRRDYGQPMPHTLVTLDSTPGSVHYSLRNMKRFSYALALGLAKRFPWPFVVTQGLCAIFLYALRAIEILIGRESAPAFSVKAANDERLALKSVRRVYLYSKEDKIIFWQDIEAHAAEATRKGYTVDCVRFEGSGHVGHMRTWPEKYWGTILQAWKSAVATVYKE